MKRLTLMLVLLAVGSAACAKSESPTSPSSPSSSGATINGTVSSGSGSSGSTSGLTGSTMSNIPGGVTVTVVGTTITATIDGAGRFQLKNVPAGNIELKFSGSGYNATVTLTEVAGSQTVTITIILTPTSAVVDVDERKHGSEEELEGRIEDLPASPVNSLVVAGRTVTTNSSTTYKLHGSPATFADLAIGQRVHVKGQTTGTGTAISLLAREIKIQNINGGSGDLNLEGVISAFSGTPSAFQFMVNGQQVKGDAATEFYGNSQFAELVNGAEVTVKGQQRTGYIYASRLHIEREAMEFTAKITATSGTSPNLTLTIGAYTVKTTNETEVKRKGDRQDPSTLQVGQTVEVEGFLQPDGKVLAKEIGIEADAVGGLFEMEGSMSSKTGTCPTVTFSVSGFAIKTDALTTFTPAGSCSALSGGTKVLVKGTVQADFSVLASSVTKK